jgi:hypothetical protein
MSSVKTKQERGLLRPVLTREARIRDVSFDAKIFNLYVGFWRKRGQPGIRLFLYKSNQLYVMKGTCDGTKRPRKVASRPKTKIQLAERASLLAAVGASTMHWML